MKAAQTPAHPQIHWNQSSGIILPACRRCGRWRRQPGGCTVSRNSADGRHCCAKMKRCIWIVVVVCACYEPGKEEMGQFYSHLLLSLQDSSLEGGQLILYELLTLSGLLLLAPFYVIVFSFPSNVSLRLLLWFTLPQKHNCIFLPFNKKRFLPFKRRKKKKNLSWHRNRLHLSCWLGWNYKTAAFWHISMPGFHCPTSENGEFLKKQSRFCS